MNGRIYSIFLCISIQTVLWVICVTEKIGSKHNHRPRVVTVSGYIYRQIENHEPNVILLTGTNSLRYPPFQPKTLKSPNFNASASLKNHKTYDFKEFHSKAQPIRLFPPLFRAFNPNGRNYPSNILRPPKVDAAVAIPIHRKPKPACCQGNSKSVPSKSTEESSHKSASQPAEENTHKTSDEKKSEEYESKEISAKSSSKEWSDGSSEEHSHRDTGKKHHHHSEEKKPTNSYEHKKEKVDGTKYNEQGRKRKGYENNVGYKNFSTFSKGKKNKYDEEDHSEYSDAENSQESFNHDSQKQQKKQQAKEFKEGGKINEQKKHMKGSKTLGYHNVLHKDEYKKKRTFYDDYDDRGFYKLFGL